MASTNLLVPATSLMGGKSAPADAEFNSTDLNPTFIDTKASANESTKKKLTRVQRKENANKKLEEKINADIRLKELEEEKIGFEMTITKAKIESFTKSEEKKRLSEELAQQKEKLEIAEIKNKFAIALPKFKEKYTNSDGIIYEVPMYSCVIKNESDKPILKVLLDERSKRANWLEFIGGKDDRKKENWMSLIKPELKTITQLANEDENANILLSLLEKYSSIRVINSQPTAQQSVPAKPAAPAQQTQPAAPAQSTIPQEVSVPPKPQQPTPEKKSN